MEQRIYHPTEITSYQYCPMKWKLQYVDQVQVPFHSWPKVRGTAIHAVLEYGNMNRFDEIWDGVVADHQNEAPLTVDEGRVTKDKEEAREICREYFKRKAALGIEILETEKNILFDIIHPKDPKRVYSFSGTVDAIARFPNTPEGMVEVFDYKTGRQYSDNALNRNLQFGLYYVGMKYGDLENVNNLWWVSMNDFKLRKRKTGKGGVGDPMGRGWHSIKITDNDMLNYIVPQTMNIIELMKRPRYALQSSASSSAPCSHCEFATSGHCPSFEVGRTQGLEINELENMKDEMEIGELMKKLGGMTDD